MENIGYMKIRIMISVEKRSFLTLGSEYLFFKDRFGRINFDKNNNVKDRHFRLLFFVCFASAFQERKKILVAVVFQFVVLGSLADFIADFFLRPVFVYENLYHYHIRKQQPSGNHHEE